MNENFVEIMNETEKMNNDMCETTELIQICDHASFASLTSLFPEKEIILVDEQPNIYASITVNGKTFRKLIADHNTTNTNSTKISDPNQNIPVSKSIFLLLKNLSKSETAVIKNITEFLTITVDGKEFIYKVKKNEKAEEIRRSSSEIDILNLPDSSFAFLAALYPETPVELTKDKKGVYACLNVDKNRTFRHELAPYKTKGKEFVTCSDLEANMLKKEFPQNEIIIMDKKDGIYEAMNIEDKTIGHKLMIFKESSSPQTEVKGIANAIHMTFNDDSGCTCAKVAISGKTMYYNILSYNKKTVMKTLTAYAKQLVKKNML